MRRVYLVGFTLDVERTVAVPVNTVVQEEISEVKKKALETVRDLLLEAGWGALVDLRSVYVTEEGTVE